MKFSFAISFSSFDRNIARELSQKLISKGCKVFFDEDFEHELLGKNGIDYFNDVFFKQSQYCIVILSSNYEKSAWTQLERRAIQAREFELHDDYLIPVVLDDFRPNWLLPTKIHFDLKNRGIDKLVDLLQKKAYIEHYGPFKKTAEFTKLSHYASLKCSTTDIKNEFLLWSANVYKDPPKIVFLRKDLGKWDFEHTKLNGRGKDCFKIKDIVITSTYHRNKAVRVYDLNSGIESPYYLTIDDLKESIAACAFDGVTLYFLYSKGEYWKFNVYTKASSCFYKYNDETPYSSLDKFCICGENRIAASQNGHIVIFSKDGQVIENHNFSKHIMSLAYNRRYDALIIANSEKIILFDLKEKCIKREFELTLTGVPYVKTSEKSDFIVALTGHHMPNNTMEIFHIGQNKQLCVIDAGRHLSWMDVCITEDGNAILAILGNSYNYEKPNGKLILLEVDSG